MSVLSVRNHSFPSFLWERIREEVRIFFSLSAPINRTRFWIYPVVWVGGYWFALFLFLDILDRTNFSGFDINNDNLYALVAIEISATVPFTLALLISSIKRLRHMNKPTWLAWASVTLLCFMPLHFISYKHSTEAHYIYNDWLNLFTNKQAYIIGYLYTYKFAPLGSVLFILYLGLFPINWQEMYSFLTKHLFNKR